MSEVNATIQQHDYLIDAQGLQIPQALVSPHGLEKISDFARAVLRSHLDEPIDIIVGDDVSGRVPALIMHRFLRLAQGGGHINSVPRTFFMASGIIRGKGWQEEERIEEDWRANLAGHASRILGAVTANKVLVLTETTGSGRSVRRLEEAFSANGVAHVDYRAIGGNDVYLSGTDSAKPDRPIVGVEKYAPEPISRRHSEFNGEQSAQLRHFLRDYTNVIYTMVFDEEPPK